MPTFLFTPAPLTCHVTDYLIREMVRRAAFSELRRARSRNSLAKRIFLSATVITIFLCRTKRTKQKEYVWHSSCVPRSSLDCFFWLWKEHILLNSILMNDQTHEMKFAVIENGFGDVWVCIDENILSENVW